MPRKYIDLSHLPSPLTVAAPESLPASIDFRDAFGPVVDQGEIGDCTGCSLAGMMQALIVEAGRPAVVLDVDEIYYEERLAEGTPTQDSGANPVDGLNFLQRVGVAPAQDGPAPDVLETTPPTMQALQDGALYRIASWAPIALTQSADARTAILPVLQLLAQQVPIEIAIAVHQSFENAGDGNIPMPGEPPQDPMMGGHAIVLAGYKDDTTAPGGGYVIFRNSWTASWGDGGYGYLPYAYLADTSLTYGLWYATLAPETAAITPQPETLPVYVDGKLTSVPAYTDLVEGYVFAPIVLLARAMGATATRSLSRVTIQTSAGAKPGFLRRLFGGA